MTEQKHVDIPGLLSITLLLLLAWPLMVMAQLSSYGSTIVFNSPEVRNVVLHPVSPENGEPVDDLPSVPATASPEGELTVRNARYGVDPDKYEVALQPGRYVITYGFASFPVYLNYDGSEVNFSDAPNLLITPGTGFELGGAGGAEPATETNGSEAPESRLPDDPGADFDVDAYLAELDRIIDTGDVSTVCEGCRYTVEVEYGRINRWREERRVRTDKVDRLRNGIQALNNSIKNTGDPNGTLAQERERTEEQLRTAKELVRAAEVEIAKAMLEIFGCLRQNCQLPAIPAASLDYFPLYDSSGWFDQIRADLLYHYFVSTDCELCQATARGINEWIVSNAAYLTSYETREEYVTMLRAKRKELEACARALCVDPEESMSVSGIDITAPGDEASQDGGTDTEPEGGAEGVETPVEDEEPERVGIKPMSVDDTGLYAIREPGFDIQAGVGVFRFADLEYNVGMSSAEAVNIFGVSESAVRSRADDQTVGVAVEVGHSWEYNDGLIRTALIYQDLSAMSGEVTVDLGNGGEARSTGQSDVEVFGISVERVKFFQTSAVDGLMSYTLGGGLKRAERDDTSVTTLSRNGIELQRTEISESDSDTALFLRVGVGYHLSPRDSFSLTLDASDGFFQSNSSMTSLLLTYRHAFSIPHQGP